MVAPVGKVWLKVKPLTPNISAVLFMVYVIVVLPPGPMVVGEKATEKVGGAACARAQNSRLVIRITVRNA